MYKYIVIDYYDFIVIEYVMSNFESLYDGFMIINLIFDD